jgi:hypothetical protein
MDFDTVRQKESPSDEVKDDISDDALPVDPHHPQTHDGVDLTEPLNPQATKAKSSDVLTVLAAGCALVSDGYQNNVQNVRVYLEYTEVMMLNLYSKRIPAQQYTLRQKIWISCLHTISIY